MTEDEGTPKAVERARAVYDQIIDGWKDSPLQPTLHLRLELERPFRPGKPGDAYEARVCPHGTPIVVDCQMCDGPPS